MRDLQVLARPPGSRRALVFPACLAQPAESRVELPFCSARMGIDSLEIRQTADGLDGPLPERRPDLPGRPPTTRPPDH